MIPSKQIINISDELAKSIKGRNDSYLEIFVNPTGTELLSIYKTTKSEPKEVRYILYTNAKKIYLWDAYVAIHEVVTDMLGLINVPYLILGYARFENGTHLKFNNAITIQYAFSDISSNNSYSTKAEDFLKKIFKNSYSWADSYISGFSNYINERSQEFNKFLKKKK